MKQTILLFCLFLYSVSTGAQSLYTDGDSLDINNLKAYVFLHGDVWGLTDTVSIHGQSMMPTQYPRNSRKCITHYAGIWVSAYDQSNHLHAAAAFHRSAGADLWPGPLDSAGNTNAATIDKWARTWKVYQTQIDTFLSLATHTVTNTPQPILEWPAKNNPYAKGRNNQPLVVNRNLAPFVDADNNGSYDPLAGDYPLIKGDEMIWWIINDNGTTHNVTHGLPLKIEIQNAAYAFRSGTNMDNVVFQEFQLNNRSTNDYDSMRVAMNMDFDLGYAFDDYIGFDSAYRIGYVYNGNAIDGVPSDSTYGVHVPVAGICMLEQPGDNLPDKQPAGVCIYYNIDNSAFGIPAADTEFNNYMHARTRTMGYHFTNDYTGPGHPSSATQPGPYTNYVYTGNPSDTSQWSECSAGNPVGDRRLVLGTADFILNAGASATVSMALIASDTTAGNACPTINIHSLEMIADSAQYAYRNALSVAKLGSIAGGISVYPNPATSTLHIDALTKIEGLEVYDLPGRLLALDNALKGKSCELNAANLSPGVYFIKIRAGKNIIMSRFVKQ